MGIETGTNGAARTAGAAAADVRAIAAVSLNRVIGRGGRLPWDLPEDVAYLHECVRGGVVIEGRRCYESRGRAFPGAARTIVLSGRTSWRPADATVCASLEEALREAAPTGRTIWIAGGERVYAEGLPFCRRLHLTLVHREYSGDTFFPEWRNRFPVELSRTDSQDGGLRFSFLVLAPRGAENRTPLS